jgi:hypothetical protein
MGRGLGFEEAFHKAYQETCPNGLDELQTETLYLLNSKKVKAMKVLKYFSGLVASMALAAGSLFKFMHWPYATMLINVGILVFCFVFVPFTFINHLRNNAQHIPSEKNRMILGLLSALLFATGLSFKILHFPTAGILMVLGSALFIFAFLPMLFFKMYKNAH